MITTRKLHGDETGAIPYLIMVFIALIAMICVAAIFNKGWELLSALLISVGVLFTVQVVPLMKGLPAAVAGLVLIACGVIVWF